MEVHDQIITLLSPWLQSLPCWHTFWKRITPETRTQWLRIVKRPDTPHPHSFFVLLFLHDRPSPEDPCFPQMKEKFQRWISSNRFSLLQLKNILDLHHCAQLWARSHISPRFPSILSAHHKDSLEKHIKYLLEEIPNGSILLQMNNASAWNHEIWNELAKITHFNRLDRFYIVKKVTFYIKLYLSNKTVEVTMNNISSPLDLIRRIMELSPNPNRLTIKQWCARFEYVGAINLRTDRPDLTNFEYSDACLRETPTRICEAKNYDKKTQLFSGDVDLEDDINDPFLLKTCFHAVSVRSFFLFYDSSNECSAVDEILKRHPTCFICRANVQEQDVEDLLSIRNYKQISRLPFLQDTIEHDQENPTTFIPCWIVDCKSKAVIQCVRCHVASYCSELHRQEHWKNRHSFVCNAKEWDVEDVPKGSEISEKKVKKNTHEDESYEGQIMIDQILYSLFNHIIQEYAFDLERHSSEIVYK
jgi:hypothetical protein